MGTVKALIKFIVVSAGLVLIAIAVAVLFAMTQLENTVRRGIERSLSHVYQTQVMLDRISLSPGDQALQLHDLIIFNPENFDEGTAMAFPNVSIVFDLTTVFSETPALKKIVLRDTVVNLRYEAGTGTNLRALYASAARLQGENAPAETGTRRRFVVREFRSETSTLNLSSNFVPIPNVALTIEPFTLTDIGSGEPVSTASMATLFIRSLFTQGLSVDGILGPIADRIQEEIQALTNEDEKAEPAETPAE